MLHYDGFIKAKDGIKLYYQNWVPEDKIKGAVILVHGILEHSGRYMNVVNTLVPAGYSVWGFDHRGHGKSEGTRVFVKKFDVYLNDLNTLISFIREREGDIPLHLLGHSMGSLIAAHYIAKTDNKDNFKSLILSGTGAATGPDISGFVIFVSKILSFLTPKLRLPAGTDPNFISHDQEVVEAYVNDPLIELKVTPRIAVEVVNAVNKMLNIAPKIKIPTLMQIGSEDRAFDPNSWNPLFNALGTDTKEFKLYEGFRHEVYNEIKKEEPLKDLLEWINTYNN